jgi:hypothetical protein
MTFSKPILAALGLFVAVCAAAILMPDLALASTGRNLLPVPDLGDALTYAAITMAAMRANLEQLEARAVSKLAEIKDDTPADDVRRIEAEHESILSEIDKLRSDIAARERVEADAADAADPDDAPESDAGGDDVREAVRSAIAAERTRVSDIQLLSRRHGMPDDFTANHIRLESDVPTVRAAILETLAERSNATATFPHVEIGAIDETTSRRRGMTDAIVARLARAAGQRDVQIPDHARQWGERELSEIAADCVNWRGPLRTARQLSEMFERAFHTTSDFPGIFSDALNVRLLARYEAAAPTYRLFSTRMTTPDFKQMNVIRAGDFPALQAVPESGEVKAGTFGESKEVVQTKPYGVQLRITRVMLVNDQLMAIEQVLSSSGARVADWENNLMFTALLSASGAGPTLLTDSTAVFHTAKHGNLTSSGTAITVASIGLGRAMMAKQVSLDGIKLNLKPRTILCGPDSITSAEQLVATITPSAPANAVPESIRSLMPASDANIDGYAWYLFADPEVAPVFAYSYLEGFEGPRLTSEDGFDVQGMKMKLEHDFGAGAIDYRGGYRNAGAAPS